MVLFIQKFVLEFHHSIIVSDDRKIVNQFKKIKFYSEYHYTEQPHVSFYHARRLTQYFNIL